jgi:hypothetical protein
MTNKRYKTIYVDDTGFRYFSAQANRSSVLTLPGAYGLFWCLSIDNESFREITKRLAGTTFPFFVMPTSEYLQCKKI